jgi:AcrR family transcriptional regulator
MLHRDSARDTILDTAVQMASVDGLRGLTIGVLASTVQMTKGGISAHFPSKKALQLATAERAAMLFREAVIAPALRKGPGLARLRALGEAWLDYLDSGTFAGGCFFTNAALEMDDAVEREVGDYVREQYGRYLDFIERSIREAVDAGHLTDGIRPRQLALELHGVFAAAVLWHSIGRPDAAAVARTAFRGLLKRVTRR